MRRLRRPDHTARMCCAAQGFEGARGAGWLEVEPELLASVSTIAQGSRVVGVYEQRWQRAARGRSRSRSGACGDPGNVGTIDARGARVRRGLRGARAPLRRPVRPEGRPRARSGRSSGRDSPASSALDELPRPVVALVAGAPEPLAGPRERERRCWSAASATACPTRCSPARDEVRSIPQVAGDSLNAAMAATVALYEATRMARPVSTLDRIAAIRAEAQAAVAAAADSAALEELRVRFLGRKAELPQLLRGVAELPPEQRGAVGSAANAARQALERADRAAAGRRSPASELDARLRERSRRRHAARRAARARPATCT